jgi:hypothetical protein
VSCEQHGLDENRVEIWSENVKGREHLEGVKRRWKNNITCNDRGKIQNYMTTRVENKIRTGDFPSATYILSE